MRLENDDVFNGYYQMEFDRIPYIFRFGRKRIKVMFSVLIVFIVATCATWSIFYSTKESHYIAPAKAGYEPVCINSYDYRILIVAIVLAILVMLISLWMTLSLVYERKAFAKATDLAARLNIEREEKVRERFQEWKLHNREY